MAFVKVRIPRTSQPQDACGIDWDNPITKGLIFDQVGQSYEKSIGYGPLVHDVSALGKRVGGASGAYVAPRSNVYIRQRQGGNDYCGLSFLFIGELKSTGFTNQYVFDFGNDRLTVNNVGVVTYTDTARSVSWSGLGDCRPLIISRGGPKYMFTKVVQNGQLVASNTNPDAYFNLTLQSVLGRNNYTSTDYTNSIAEALAFWDRALTDEEIKSLSDNPWQIFEPEELTIWVPDEVGAGGPATVIPIGVQANSAIGTLTAIGAAIAALSGVSATGSVGIPTATGGTSIPATALPSGLIATASVGAPTAKGQAKALPTGVQAISAVGTATATGQGKATPSGVSASSAVGTPLAIAGTSIPATVLPAGVASLAYIGSPTATGQAKAYPFGVQATGAVGTPAVTAGGAAVALPLGVSASSAVSAPVGMGAAAAYPLGLAGYWSVGTPVAVVTGVAVYPPPDKVLLGFAYGPTGADYTGTATGGTGPTASEIAAAVTAALQATTLPVNLIQVRGQTVGGAGTPANPWGPG